MKKKFLKRLIIIALITSLVFVCGFAIKKYCFSSPVAQACMSNISNVKDIVLEHLEERVGDINEIIIHHSAGENTSLEDINRIHLNKGYGGIGYNYYIRTDGSILEGRGLEYRGAHCYGKNDTAIGICLEGNFDNHEPSTSQMGSLLALTTELSSYFGIDKISPHRDHYNTACPGAYFRWDDFVRIYNKLIRN